MNLRPIHILIEQAKHWRAYHLTSGRNIEAAACDIRIHALEEALRAMEMASG